MNALDYREILCKAPFAYATHEMLHDKEGLAVDYRFIEVNEAFTHITDLREDQLIGHNITSVLPGFADEGFDWIALYAKVAREGTRISFEQYAEKIGKWFRVHAFSHQKGFFTTIFIDLSEEKARAAELENFFSVNLDLLCIADTDGRFLKVNREWEKLLGYSTKQLQSGRFFDYVHPDDIEETLAAVGRLTDNEEVLNFTNRYRDSGGNYHFIEWRSHPNGKLIYAAARDVTQQKLMEQELRESRDRLELVMEAGEHGFWDWDVVNDRTYLSAAYYTMLGYQKGDLPDTITAVYDLIHPDDRARVLPCLNECIEKGLSYDFEFRLKCAGGNYKWISAKGKGYLDSDSGEPRRVVGVHVDIDRRKRAEEDTANREQLFRILFENSPLGIYIADVDGNIIDGNKQLLELLGSPSIEQTRKINVLQFPPLVKNGYAQKFRETVTTGETGRIELEYTSKWGKTIFLSSYLIPLCDKSGEISTVYTLMEDISERKQIEKLLSASEQNFRTFFETMDDMIFIADEKGEIFFTNHTVSEKLGFSTAELAGMQILDVHAQNNRAEAEQIFSDMFAGRRSICPLPLCSKSGFLVPVETRVWFGQWDSKPCIFGISKDLSKEQAALQKFDKLFKRNPALMAVTELPQGKFTEVNESFLKTLGYTADEVIGKTAAQLDLFADSSQQSLVASKLKENGTIANIEMKVRTKDGRILDGLFSGEMIDNQGRLYSLTVMTDLTERKHAEEQLVLALQHSDILREKAEEATRAKSEFLANMSHEIRTPLNAVIGFTELLQKTPLNTLQQQYAHNANISAQALLGIINDILDFSKIEAGRLDLELIKADIVELTEHAADILKFHAAQKDLELLVEIEPGINRYAEIDTVRLKQILVNLLSNAVKFTNRGEVQLSLHFNRLENSKGRYTFSVRDTGIGIEKDKMDRLFKAFSQADSSITRRFGGTGLGLIISNLLAGKMGGKIAVESEPQTGSTFSFSIECAIYPAGDEAFSSPPAISRVLIIDDNESNRIILGRNFAYWGIECIDKSDGISALKLLETDRNFDLVIVDNHMPYMSGIEVIRNIRTKLNLSAPELPVILLHSSSDDQSVHDECRTLGVRFNLIKPVKTTELYQFLRNLQFSAGIDSDTGYAQAPAQSRFRTDPQILVAEDVAMNVALIRAMIEEHFPRAQILVAANGIESLAIVREHDVDVILMDIQMPEMDGYAATAKIREMERGRSIPIIALTAGATKAERERCLAAGMNDYLSKPVDFELLGDKLRRYIRNGVIDDDSANRTGRENTGTFDADSLFKRLNGNQKNFQALADLSLTQFPATIDELQTALDRSDSEEIRMLSHRLKGAALNMCFGRLAGLAKEAEAEHKDNERTMRLLDEIRKEWHEVEIVLKKNMTNEQDIRHHA